MPEAMPASVPPFLRAYSGRGVRVAVVDSGVHATHPHVGGVEQGVGLREDGTIDVDFVDTLGHGTAVTAAVREKAPEASLVAIKVFWRTLATDAASLVRGIDEACRRGAHVINLSLGTANAAHRDALDAAVGRAIQQGACIVAAGENDGVAWLPGTMEGVVAVGLDWDCPRDEYRVVEREGRATVLASGYPRDIPGVPRERNLKGLSFAVANVSGFVARALEAKPQATMGELVEMLARAGRPTVEMR
jgi:subtilisin family serine protease